MNTLISLHEMVNAAFRQHGGIGITDVVILRSKDENHNKILEHVRGFNARLRDMPHDKPEGLEMK